MTWSVYIARCGDGSLYTGITTDPVGRMAAHNAGVGAAYTRGRGPVRLAYRESAADRSRALRREWEIKQLTRTEKEQLMRAAAQPRRARGDSAAFRGFQPAALEFFRRLKRNNRREWFEANRSRYEIDVRQPLQALVEEVDVGLARLAPEIVGDPRRSIFRIHRDVRFSQDKSPYKTNAACWFYHRDAGRGVGSEADGGGAGFYFHLATDECFVGGGIWMPPRESLNRIRSAIVDRQREFERTLAGRSFRRRFGQLDEEEMLKRLPRGFSEGHPATPWLRYRSFTASRPLTRKETLSPRLPARLLGDFATLLPLVRWLNAALGHRPSPRRL